MTDICGVPVLTLRVLGVRKSIAHAEKERWRVAMTLYLRVRKPFAYAILKLAFYITPDKATANAASGFEAPIRFSDVISFLRTPRRKLMEH